MQLTSFYTALTGLSNNSVAINTIGDNLANMNTTAFKASKATFAELLAGVSGTSSSGNPISYGLGSTLSGIIRNCSQGTINYTGNATDAAINGNGYFVVSTNGGMAFTRSGQFGFDATGNLVSSDGFNVMGYMAVNGAINNAGAVSTIAINKGQLIPASATTIMSITANLDSATDINGTYSSSIRIYDSLGTSHAVSLNFTKTALGEWTWTASIPAEDAGGNVGDPGVVIGSGDLQFDSSGVLISPTTNPALNISGLSSGAADMDIEFNLVGSAGTPILTSCDSASTVNTTTQNGFEPSALKSISIDNKGVIVGLAENGNSIPLAQLALANFPNEQGLQKYQGSTFITFTSTGEPSIGIAGAGGRGSVTGASLEQSNVDMAQEFVNLIVAQRAYQANSRVITTTDELYQDSLNLKR
jgi:flagellar hook protein FlgE